MPVIRRVQYCAGGDGSFSAVIVDLGLMITIPLCGQCPVEQSHS
jgi:hypothetical protein